MDLKKFYIERALYPAMALLQKNRVMEYTKALQASERQDPDQLAANQRQQLTELLFLCRRQVPAYSDLSFTDLELRREPMDCLQAVDPILLMDFLTSTREYLRQDVDVTELHARYCNLGDQPPATIYLTQEQIERYEAARWRGLSWYGVTPGSPSVDLWDQPHAPFVLQEEPYLKNRLAVSVCAMTERSVRPTAEEIDGFKPEYITGSASSLDTMARAMLRPMSVSSPPPRWSPLPVDWPTGSFWIACRRPLAARRHWSSPAAWRASWAICAPRDTCILRRSTATWKFSIPEPGPPWPPVSGDWWRSPTCWMRPCPTCG